MSAWVVALFALGAVTDRGSIRPHARSTGEPATNEGVRGDPQLLQAMVSQHFHEDTLYWDQIKLLLTLQLAFFAGWYAVGRSWFGPVLMVASAELSRRVWLLANAIQRNRDVNLDAIQVLASKVLSSDSRRQLAALRCQPPEFVQPLQFATHSLGDVRDPGRRFQHRAFWFCIALNIGLAVSGVHDQLATTDWLSYLHPKFARSGRPNTGLEPTAPALTPGAAAQPER